MPTTQIDLSVLSVIIDISEKKCEKIDARFQLVYAEAVSATNKLGKKYPCLCEQQKIGVAFYHKWSRNTGKHQYTYCPLKFYLLI